MFFSIFLLCIATACSAILYIVKEIRVQRKTKGIPNGQRKPIPYLGDAVHMLE
eukprot:Pgem_evm1s13475